MLSLVNKCLIPVPNVIKMMMLENSWAGFSRVRNVKKVTPLTVITVTTIQIIARNKFNKKTVEDFSSEKF